MELIAHQQIRNKRVYIFAFENSCPECKKLSGRMYTNYETLREKPFPAKHAISGYKIAGKGGAGVHIHLGNELLIF
jgi:hypothetical protein